jgi:NADPH-dependent glutamate synthase beta subunit-like oxidoreductase
MEFLTQQNKRIGKESFSDEEITAAGKNVVVIGGGDTGSDCIGTSRRQGAKSIHQIEILQKPPDDRSPINPWPTWPSILRTSSAQEEGCDRSWSISTKEFAGRDGKVDTLRCVLLEWSEPDAAGRRTSREVPGSEFEIPAELVLLSMGFVHVEHGPLVRDLSLTLDARGNLAVDENRMTSTPGVFAAGDSMLGASLVVRAIDAGRLAAEGIDLYLARISHHGS